LRKALPLKRRKNDTRDSASECVFIVERNSGWKDSRME
jgi:hypothetical protein